MKIGDGFAATGKAGAMERSNEPPEIVKEIVFDKAKKAQLRQPKGRRNSGPPEGFIESPDRPGIWAHPDAISQFKSLVAGKLEIQESEDNDPEVKALANELRQIRLPAEERAGRKTNSSEVVTIMDAERLARYLVHGRGVRVHPDLETVRWIPTPGKAGSGGTMDAGTHISKGDDGHWPVVDPEAFYDMDQIEVAQDPSNGEWVASHPSGVHHSSHSKMKAQAACVNELMQRIEHTREAMNVGGSDGHTDQ